MKDARNTEQQLNMKIDELKINLELKINELNRQRSDFDNTVNLLNTDITLRDRKTSDLEVKMIENDKYFINVKNNLEQDLLQTKTELSAQSRLKNDLDSHVQILSAQNSDLGNRINLVKQDAEVSTMEKLNAIRNLEEKSNVLTHEKFTIEVELKSRCEELQRNLEKSINENRAIKIDADNVSSYLKQQINFKDNKIIELEGLLTNKTREFVSSKYSYDKNINELQSKIFVTDKNYMDTINTYKMESELEKNKLNIENKSLKDELF